MDLLNKSTGTLEPVEQDKLPGSLGSGKYDLVKGSSLDVINPNGELVSIPAEQAHDALIRGGYRIPTSIDLTNFENKIKYGEGFGNEAKAFGEAAARTATFGLSDYIGDPEAKKLRKELNPNAALLGDIAGVAGSLLVPSPVGLVSKATGLIAKEAAPITSAAAKFLANPETSPIAAKVIDTVGKASAHALGSAVEGAAYGAGQVVSEHALGDPDLNAEKILGTMGESALIGGVFGGGLNLAAQGISKGLKGLQELTGLKQELSDIARSGAPESIEQTSASLPDALKASGMEEKNLEGIVGGLKKLKTNANEIKAAAADIGAPVLESQISDSKLIQDMDSVLMNSPTMHGVARQELLQKGIRAAENAVDGAIKTSTDLTEVQVGNKIKEGLINFVKKEKEPIEEIYNTIKQKHELIPLKQRALDSIARNIMKIDGIAVSPSSPEYKLAKSVSEEIKNLKSVDQLKQYQSALRRRSIGVPELKFVSGEISEKLKNLEENSIVSFAKENMKTSIAKEKILSLLDQRQSANAAYTVLRDKMERIGEVLGKKRISGPEGFIDHLEEMVPEKLANRLFSKGNSEFLEYFSKQFPNETNLLKDLVKNEIKNSASKDGIITTSKIFRELDKLSPEIKNILFTGDDLKKIKSARIYMESIPKNINPSGTSKSEAFREAIKGPLSYAYKNLTDYAASKAITSIQNPNSLIVSGLSKIENAAKRTTKKILNESESIFEGAKKYKSIGVYLGSEYAHDNFISDKEKYKKVTNKIKDISRDPDSIIDHTSGSTKDLNEFAPSISTSINMSMVRAIDFLSSKIPQNTRPDLFSKEQGPSDSDILRFQGYYNTVKSPVSVLAHVSAGTLTKDHLETLNTVYPKLYEDMKKSVIDNFAKYIGKKEKEPLPFKTKLALSMFLDENICSSLQQQTIAANQQSIAATQMNGPEGRSVAGGLVKPTSYGASKITLSDRSQTNVQAVAGRE